MRLTPGCAGALGEAACEEYSDSGATCTRTLLCPTDTTSVHQMSRGFLPACRSGRGSSAPPFRYYRLPGVEHLCDIRSYHAE